MSADVTIGNVCSKEYDIDHINYITILHNFLIPSGIVDCILRGILCVHHTYILSNFECKVVLNPCVVHTNVFISNYNLGIYNIFHL